MDNVKYGANVKPITRTRRTPYVPQERDTYETPNYATDILIPFIPNNATHVRECSAGNRKISNRLISHDYNVVSSDIRPNKNVTLHNFLYDYPPFDMHQLPIVIITNPPYSIKELFIAKAIEYDVPFAFLINADYSGQQIRWVNDYGCEKIIPNRRINYIPPNIINRINAKEGTQYEQVSEIPNTLLAKYSSCQFHSMWLTHGFRLGKTETFVELPIQQIKNNI